MSDPKTRRRRYRQFSLRTVLVVLTLVCVWFGWQVNRANQQRKVVAWVLEMGGSVRYDYEIDDAGVAIADAKPTSPEWLRDFYDQVVYVHLNDTQVSDLTPLANLKSLEWLHLGNTLVSDLTPLANLKSLQRLVLGNTQVSDLTPLANLKSLKWLVLWDTQVSDLTPLENLIGLERLDLSDTQVSDLTPLANLNSLEWLDLRGTPSREEQITKLQQALPNCKIYK